MKGKKVLFLHLGFHKSASTSIQRTLVANRDILRRQNKLHYPVFQPYARHNHNVPLLSMFLENPQETPVHFHCRRSLEDIRQMNVVFRTSLEKSLKQFEKIILSSESSGQLGRHYLLRIKKYLEGFGFQLIVLVIVRSPLTYLTSWTQERIKKGVYIDARNIFAGNSPKILLLKEIFQENVSFLPFRKACLHQNGPVGSFLAQIGIEDQEIIQFQKLNKSISREAATLINYLNSKYPIVIEGKLNREGRSLEDLVPLFQVAGRKFRLDFSQMQRCQQLIEQENILFRDLLGEDFCDHENWTETTTIEDNSSYDLERSTIESIRLIYPQLKPHLKKSVREHLSTQFSISL